MPGPWQLCFDDGHQQRYLPDRQAVLRYVLAIGPQAASKRFEVFRESQTDQLADGRRGGRTFALAEVIDLDRAGETERLQAELFHLANEERESDSNGLLSQPESHTFDVEGGPVTPRTIIPLLPGVARPRGERRKAMQQAVVEVVRHLVLKAVPPDHRTPLFDQARDLLSEAGWGLDELFEAAEEGPARSALFRALGLET